MWSYVQPFVGRKYVRTEKSNGNSVPWPLIDMPTNWQAPDSQPICSVSHYFFFTPSFGWIHILVAVNAYLIRSKSDGWNRGRGGRNYNIGSSRAGDFSLWTAANTFHNQKEKIHFFIWLPLKIALPGKSNCLREIKLSQKVKAHNCSSIDAVKSVPNTYSLCNDFGCRNCAVDWSKKFTQSEKVLLQGVLIVVVIKSGYICTR